MINYLHVLLTKLGGGWASWERQCHQLSLVTLEFHKHSFRRIRSKGKRQGCRKRKKGSEKDPCAKRQLVSDNKEVLISGMSPFLLGTKLHPENISIVYVSIPQSQPSKSS